MTGRIVILGILAFALLAGAGVWYTQNYAYYVRLDTSAGVLLWGPDGAAASIEPIAFSGVDADSSPIRYRACLDLGPLPADLPPHLIPYPDPEPGNAPPWFDCFDAASLGADLEAGRAVAVLGNPTDAGTDRVVALYPDGHGFAWSQINACYLATVNNEAMPTGCHPDVIAPLPDYPGAPDLSGFFLRPQGDT